MLPLLLALLAVFAANPVTAAATLQPFPVTGIALDPFLNNNAASPDGSANFDNHGSSFDSQFLPTGAFTYDGITYNLPSSWGSGKNDNVISMNQLVTLDKPTFIHEIHFLFVTDANGDGVNAYSSTLNWADNTTEVLELQTRNWWSWPIINPGAIQTPYNFINAAKEKNFNGSHIHQWSTSLTSDRQLSSITLPKLDNGRRLHFFGIAYSSAADATNTTGPVLSIRRARFTNRWENVGNTKAQVVQVTVANLLPTGALSASNSLNSRHTVEISGSGIKTLTPGIANRLVPGDQVRVDVLVTGVRDGTTASVTIKDAKGRSLGVSDGWAASALIKQWTADSSTLMKHETPTWWNNAKYGIFIHWGVYSVPAWSPPDSYAEWYNWWLHEDPHNTSNPTFAHHLETYGKNMVYDDFIANFTASKFNASEWLDLFDRAGMRYFVLVTKHHDGYALFDTGNTTHRSSVYSGPKRDLVKELFDTAAKEKPNIHRGTYYSLPEWFNPDYAKYGFSSWPGGLARNVFNSSEEPYTGKLNITDYLTDIQLPHMLQLANQYETEIMWCDIGGPNKTLEFAAEFYTQAFQQGRQVTINNRCGAVPDYSTPEYSTFNAIQTDAWESNAGMDPFSYGLNSATEPSQYKNGTTLVRTLVDIVSKGGNFLIDVGPNAEGEIIAPMANNLLDAGAWLQHSGECIYDTNYWFQGSQETNLAPGVVNAARFTRTAKTFCIVVFDPPSSGKLVVRKRLPLLPGDEIRFLSPTAGHALPWSMNASTGTVTIDVSSSRHAISQVQFGWAFQVQFKLDV